MRMSEEVYIVKKGDTLKKIAAMKNISVEKLMELNHLENTLLSVGQKLMLPPTKEIHIGSDICGTYPDGKEELSKYNSYTVKENDNLYTIAKRFNTTVATLKYINHLENDLLSKGQVLLVPGGKENTISYTVKEGDTLYTIASNSNVTPNHIITVNHLASTSLTIGQVLQIPVPKAVNTMSKEEEEAILFDTSYPPLFYRVQKGDNLFLLANRFHIPVYKIKDANHLTQDNLVPGQILQIPK